MDGVYKSSRESDLDRGMFSVIYLNSCIHFIVRNDVIFGVTGIALGS